MAIELIYKILGYDNFINHDAIKFNLERPSTFI